MPYAENITVSIDRSKGELKGVIYKIVMLSIEDSYAKGKVEMNLLPGV